MSTVMLAFAPSGAEPPANKSQSTQTSGYVPRFSPDLGWLQARDRERLSLPASHLATRIQFQFLICGWGWHRDPGLQPANPSHKILV